MADLQSGERRVRDAVEVDVSPAQVAGKVDKAGVARDQCRLVQDVRAGGQAAAVGVSGGAGDVGDLLNPLGQ
ncbi:hypothetical protein ACFQ05_21885 [Amycolatopsis umgeniensis]|uniref:Uncharacterized protein n=1 Tax=Amycolatopsis umgeniensis TaxID=336628 RepID=A0A841BI23_9PSEU|nr:hypothetical protein [Amycolatopsis umgeniensis]MBB5858273.1 hypothetical protein [Amycolatopsis umgeniensis]